MDQVFPCKISLRSDLLALAKPRLGLMVLFATAIGFAMGSGPEFDWARLVYALIGTGLASAGAAVMNQALEARQDRLMPRTRRRPLASGRMGEGTAAMLGVVLAVAGVVCLACMTTALAACFALQTLVIYLAVYTPMKRVSPCCTLIGAVAGAMPPVIGWAAVEGPLTWEAGALFGVLFTWQIPHFMAIAWMHRDDYARAGFALIPAGDFRGRTVAARALGFAVLLAVISVLAVISGPAVYLGETLLLNGALLGFAGCFYRRRDWDSARRLFAFSVAYLPAILVLMFLARRG